MTKCLWRERMAARRAVTDGSGESSRIESKHTSGLAGGSECGSHGRTVRDCLVLCTGVDYDGIPVALARALSNSLTVTFVYYDAKGNTGHLRGRL